MSPAAPGPGPLEVAASAAAGIAALPAIRALSAPLAAMMESVERVERALQPGAAAHSRWFQDSPLGRLPLRYQPAVRRPGLLSRLRAGLAALQPAFDEDAYLYFNPDVLAAAAGGGASKGFAHWARHGRREGRAGGRPLAAAERGTVAGLAGLNFYGFLSSVSGLGTAARSVKKALEASGLRAAYFDLPNWELAKRRHRLEPGPYRTNLLFQNSDVLPLFARTHGQGLLAGRYNIAHCVWELPSLRADWAGNLVYVDEVWTPSEFNRAAYQAATPLPVRVIPYSVDGLEHVATLSRAELGVPDGVFLFSYVFDVSSGFERKNPLALLDAFQAGFGGSRDVFLLLKCFNGKYNPERMAMLRRRAAADNIGLVEEVWTHAQIHSLHRETDCFVSPHRGEGFGLNMAESMYFGRAVVATNYGANVDFMDSANSYPVAYRLVEVENPSGPYQKGNVWAEVDAHDLARQMRRAFDDGAERAAKGVAAALTIRAKYSVEAVGQLIQSRLEEIGQPRARHPRQQPRFLPRSAPGPVRAEVRQLRERPRISVITPVFNGAAEALRRCVNSVRAQWYPDWELCLCDGGSNDEETRATLAAYQGVDPRIKVIRECPRPGLAAASNRAAEFSTGECLALLDLEGELAPDALLCVARAWGEGARLDALYTDEDRIDDAGRTVNLDCKPDWSPEQLQAGMYLGRLLVLRKRLFFMMGGFREGLEGAEYYDLALRLAGRTNRIGHLPKVLYHGWQDGQAAVAPEALRRTLEEFVQRERLPAVVEPGLQPSLLRVRYRIPGTPPATLVIVTGGRDADLPVRAEVAKVERFARGIVERTEYSNYEILVAHDADLPPETARRLREMGCRLAEYRGPRQEGTFARKANWSLRQARTELVVLLNDALEVRSGGWLEALLEYSQQPWIGAVGPKLLDRAGRVRHPDMAIGAGPGRGSLDGLRNCQALAAACLATRKSVIEDIGGFDEQYGRDYSAADFCLSLIERGFRIVYTPYSELYHDEGSAPRRREEPAGELARFRAKWSNFVAADPHFHIDPSRERLDCAGRDGGG